MIIILKRVIILLLAILLISVSFYFYRLCQLQVVTVEAEPQSLPHLERIFSSRQNLLFVSPRSLEAQIEKEYPYVQKAHVMRVLPHTITVSIELRPPTAQVVNTNGNSVFVDEHGNELPNLVGFKAFLTPRISCATKNAQERQINIAALVNIINSGQNHNFDKPSALSCRSERELRLQFAVYDVIITADQNADSVVASLQYLQKQFRIEGTQPRRIDARFEKPVLIFDAAQIASDDAALAPE